MIKFIDMPQCLPGHDSESHANWVAAQGAGQTTQGMHRRPRSDFRFHSKDPGPVGEFEEVEKTGHGPARAALPFHANPDSDPPSALDEKVPQSRSMLRLEDSAAWQCTLSRACHDRI